MARKETRKTDKICVVCGISFKGTAASVTCGGACRTSLARIKAANKRPEYILMAKGKGQRIPDLSAPKRLKFKKGEKKNIDKLFEGAPVYTSPEVVIFERPLAEFYDAPMVDISKIKDELPQTAQIDEKALAIKKFKHNSEIDVKIKAVKNEPLPPGMHPRTHTLQKESRIDELEKQKI